MNFSDLYNKAHEAGMTAGNGHIPTPMVVQQHTNMADDTSPIEKQWLVDDGACGFAWVNIKPATSKFARWLKDTGKVRHRSYYGGYDIWVSEFGQSVERKERYAKAFSDVLKEAGIKSTPMSRLD